MCWVFLRSVMIGVAWVCGVSDVCLCVRHVWLGVGSGCRGWMGVDAVSGIALWSIVARFLVLASPFGGE